MSQSTPPTITAAQGEALQALQAALARAGQTGLLDAMAPSLSHPDLAQAFTDQAQAFAENNAMREMPVQRGSNGKLSMKALDEELKRAAPLMRCGNRTEFMQRLQWLSEGMLRNHLEHITNPQIDQQEIAQYQKYKKERDATPMVQLPKPVDSNAVAARVAVDALGESRKPPADEKLKSIYPDDVLQAGTVLCIKREWNKDPVCLLMGHLDGSQFEAWLGYSSWATNKAKSLNVGDQIDMIGMVCAPIFSHRDYEGLRNDPREKINFFRVTDLKMAGVLTLAQDIPPCQNDLHHLPLTIY